MNNIDLINKRRIFGIISHPDAGKTTLTEKLLLHGGAIREAGTVRARKNSKFAKSDWMEIEKQRGISVTSSVMQFEYDGKVISIMDTPGHNDFGEDTYRILTSVDSAVMVIDAAKGIETQTKKLFQVCSMRGIPIFTFINKLDREAKDPLESMQELEDVLGLPSVAVTWPIGCGKEFEGVYDRLRNTIYLFRKNEEIHLDDERVNSDKLEGAISPANLKNLRYAMDLLDGAGNEFDIEKVRQGKLSPVFFGSALADFGVTEFLEHFLQMSPPPSARKTTTGSVEPTDEGFTGFIFKIQANMDPNHRDRLAFLRICSGTFVRGMNVTLSRTGKQMKLSQSTHLMANERETVDTAYAGDVEQLAQEGAIQVYRNEDNEVILGAVGVLQFEVFEYRLTNEYNTDIRMESMDFSVARWVKTDNPEGLKKYQNSRCMLVFDHYDRPVLLFTNSYALKSFQERNEDVVLIEALEVEQHEL